MLAELRVGLEDVLDHVAVVLVRVVSVLAILGHHHVKGVDGIARRRDLQLDQQVFQGNLWVETTDLLQHFATYQHGRRRWKRFAVQEQVVEIQTAKRHVATLFLLRVQVAIPVDQLDIASTHAHLRLAVHIRHLGGNTVRQHDVIRAERCDQAALGASNRTVQGGAEPLILLHLEIKAVLGLQALDAFDAVILGAVVDHQQLDIGVGLPQHTKNTLLDVLAMVVGSDDHRDQGLWLIHALPTSRKPVSIRVRYLCLNSSRVWLASR